MEGGKDQVAGEGRLHGDLRGFAVPDLADHDDVGVLAKYRTEPVGKGEIDLRVHLDLADPLELVLDRVLDGDDVLFRGVDTGEGGVKGGGLAAAGRSGNQDDAAGPGEEALHGLHIGRGETDIGQRDDPPLLVEETEHHPFAEKGGDDGYADVHIPAGDDDPDSPVLGKPFLGDVQSRHDLHPGNKGILHDLGGVSIL